MLIDCPNCAKSYHISRATVGRGGRTVACSNCNARWTVMPDAKGVADRSSGKRTASPPQEIRVEAFSERSRPATYEELYGTRAKPKAPLTAGGRQWPRLSPIAIALPVTLGLMMFALAARAAIVRIYPQANLIYAAAGLSVNERGLDLKHVRVSLFEDGPQPLLIVDGEITNRRTAKAPVPALRLAVRDPQGHEIYTWSATSPKAKLESGETVAFRARLAAPPADGYDVFVRFAATE